MTEWQPIESAPKEGYVLLSDGNTVCSGFWSHEDEVWTDGRTHGGGHGCDFYDDLESTHWMPLPQPPKLKE